jgi:hypothetical protein
MDQGREVGRQSALGFEQGHSPVGRALWRSAINRGTPTSPTAETVTAQRFEPDARRGLIGEPTHACEPVGFQNRA